MSLRKVNREGRQSYYNCKVSTILSKIAVSGMKTSTAIISIQDLTSQAFPILRQALKAVPGVQSIDFSLERSVAVVEFDVQQTKIDDLLRAVLKAGYRIL